MFLVWQTIFTKFQIFIKKLLQMNKKYAKMNMYIYELFAFTNGKRSDYENDNRDHKLQGYQQSLPGSGGKGL